MAVTEAPTATAAVIAVGRADRGDHAAGLVAADIVRRRLADRVTIIRTARGPTDWRQVSGHAAVFVVDANAAAGTPGAVERTDMISDDVTVRVDERLRDLGLAEVVTLARRERELPHVLVVYRIEGRCFTTQAGVSPEVAASAHSVAEQILSELAVDLPGAAP
jgi:hydrogenase maturation protease